jgi:adenylate kinase
MRIVIVGAAEDGIQGRLLADRLDLPYFTAEIATDIARVLANSAGFVLDGFPRTVAEAATLDRILRSRAADLDVALHFALRDAWLAPEEDALLEHYRGRVVELDATGAADEVHERVLDGLREAVVAA